MSRLIVKNLPKNVNINIHWCNRDDKTSKKKILIRSNNRFQMLN